MLVRTLQATYKDMSQDGNGKFKDTKKDPRKGYRNSRQRPAVQIYKALGLYSTSTGEPLKGFKQNSIRDRFTGCSVHSVSWRGECR